MKRHSLILLTALPLTVFAELAASKDLTARAWLGQVPSLPDSAYSAYSQWVDNDGDLKPGPGFKAFEDGLTNVMKDQMNAAAPNVNGAQMQSAMNSAEQLRQQYGSPEGQAKLRSMSPAELMALSQQMRPQTPQASGPVTPHDQQLAGRIGAYPGSADVQAGIQKTSATAAEIQSQWQKEKDALDAQQLTARNALPLCKSEAGEPSEISLRDNALKFADLKIALATKYLAKFQPSVQQMKTVVGPRIDYGDSAMVAWTSIDNTGLKSQLGAVARGAENSALGDVGVIESFIARLSKLAAQSVADKKQIQKTYANAKGC